jgi:hypothetical protein
MAAQVKFVWFAGEELGLLGSTHYVTTLNDIDVCALVGSSVASPIAACEASASPSSPLLLIPDLTSYLASGRRKYQLHAQF